MSIYTLALESSCDETSASVLKDGRTVLSNVISSQVPIHRKFGGVVPEIASRHHIEQVIPVIDQALRDANVTLQDIDHIGVTYGPGLVGALLVGVAAAKGLSFATGIPLVPVHHMEGHIFANFLANPELEPPFLSLVVSGGHTMLVHVKGYEEFDILGQTRDDAAGEAFDKIARVMGFPYPGGPHIDALAMEGDADAIAKAQAKLDELNDLDGRLRDIRPVIAAGAKNLADKLAYFRKGNLVAGDGKHLVFDKRFDGVYIIQFTDGTQIVMHDPAAAGWAYQTFAYYFDPKNDVAFGYQSLGDETKFTDLPEKGTATYNGLTTAYVVKGDQGRQLTADVKAIVDFGLKGVRFETSNSQFHSLDDNGRRVTVKGTDYDMKGTAKWENGNLFLGSVEAAAAGLKGNLSGKFYGAKAAEIGGTYGLKNQDGSEHLIGGYGAKRQ